MEIPLDGPTDEMDNSENVLEKIEETEEIVDEESNGNKEIVDEENAEPPQETPEIVEEVPAPKRPRGRPKGSVKAKPPKPQKQPNPPKQMKPKKAPKRNVRYESSDEEEELPDYVRQQMRIPQQPPSQAELAANMLRYLQEQHTAKVQQKNDLYDSWFRQYY